jgi:hypothetical protein
MKVSIAQKYDRYRLRDSPQRETHLSMVFPRLSGATSTTEQADANTTVHCILRRCSHKHTEME